MLEEYYMPIWIKAILAFILVLLGIALTYCMFRFFPVPQKAGFDARGSLMYVLTALGGILILYVVGLIMARRHPYSIFSVCMLIFIMLLISIRVFGV